MSGCVPCGDVPPPPEGRPQGYPPPPGARPAPPPPPEGIGLREVAGIAAVVVVLAVVGSAL